MKREYNKANIVKQERNSNKSLISTVGIFAANKALMVLKEEDRRLSVLDNQPKTLTKTNDLSIFNKSRNSSKNNHKNKAKMAANEVAAKAIFNSFNA